MTDAHQKSFLDSIIGAGGAFLGLITSMQEQLLWGVQFIAGGAGAICAVVAVIRIFRRTK